MRSAAPGNRSQSQEACGKWSLPASEASYLELKCSTWNPGPSLTSLLITSSSTKCPLLYLWSIYPGHISREWKTPLERLFQALTLKVKHLNFVQRRCPHDQIIHAKPFYTLLYIDYTHFSGKKGKEHNFQLQLPNFYDILYLSLKYSEWPIQFYITGITIAVIITRLCDHLLRISH